MDSLLEFDTTAEAEALGACYIHDNPGAWFRVEQLPDGRYRLVVYDAPANSTINHTPTVSHESGRCAGDGGSRYPRP
jgi:hypothetical protein